jgi:hypothetical protein
MAQWQHHKQQMCPHGSAAGLTQSSRQTGQVKSPGILREARSAASASREAPFAWDLACA